MTAKEFFKSNIFKCLVTLLCVLLVSGIFLTIMNGLLEVTDAEREQRALNKIYGKNVKTTALVVNDENNTYKDAVILKAYLDENGDYLIQSKGAGGFGGTVTCWVLVDMDGSNVKRVEKVVIDSSDGETFLSDINYLDKFKDTPYTEGFKYTTENGFVTSGASMSSNAIDNAVNGAISFILGADEDPYADFAFHNKIDMEKTSWSIDNGVITYNIVTEKNGPADPFEMTVTVGADKLIASYEVTKWGSTENDYDGVTADGYNGKVNISLYIGKDLAYFTSIIGEDGNTTSNDNYADNNIATGATYSNYLCLNAAAFAVANYDYIINYVAFTEFIDTDKTVWTVDNGVVTYNIITKKNGPANPFEMTVTVGADKSVVSYEVTKWGSTENDYDGVTADGYNGKVNIGLYIGKDLAYFTSIIGNKGEITGKDNFADNNIATGATYSNYLCLAAGAYATANYDYCLTHVSGGENNE